MHQGVEYSVVRVIKGTTTESELRVAHLLVYGSPLCDDKQPELSSHIFVPGRVVMLALELDTAGVIRDEGVKPAWVTNYIASETLREDGSMIIKG
jgi:hypothetical protein